MLTDAEVREMLARAEAATPGPWRATEGAVLCPDGRSAWGLAGSESFAERNRANLIFLAAARSDVPALAREVLALRESLREMLLIFEDDRVYLDLLDAESVAKAYKLLEVSGAD